MLSNFLSQYIEENKMDQSKTSSRNNGKVEGRYANHFAVGHNAFEFIFDFGQSYSENNQPELYTRIIISPVYAKAFLNLLQDSIEAFEIAYGSISEKTHGNSED